MSNFVFSQRRLAELRQKPGQVAALLVLPSDPVKGDEAHRRIHGFYRELRSVDGDGNVIETRCERVEYDYDGVKRPAKLTVLLVELADPYAEIILRPPPRTIDLAVARACGFGTMQELRDDWTRRHPRSDLAKLVWFTLGDVRDRDRYLQRWVSRGGDYTQNPAEAIDELPALSEAELKVLAVNARQKDEGRRAETAEALDKLTLAQRVARIEIAAERYGREVKHEIRIIASRTQRGLRKIRPGS